MKKLYLLIILIQFCLSIPKKKYNSDYTYLQVQQMKTYITNEQIKFFGTYLMQKDSYKDLPDKGKAIPYYEHAKNNMEGLSQEAQYKMDDYLKRSEYLQNEKYRHNPNLIFNKDEKNTMELPIICKKQMIVEDIFRFRSYASKYIQLWMDAFNGKDESEGEEEEEEQEKKCGQKEEIKHEYQAPKSFGYPMGWQEFIDKYENKSDSLKSQLSKKYKDYIDDFRQNHIERNEEEENDDNQNDDIKWNYLNMPALDKYQFAKFYQNMVTKMNYTRSDNKQVDVSQLTENQIDLIFDNVLFKKRRWFINWLEFWVFFCNYGHEPSQDEYLAQQKYFISQQMEQEIPAEVAMLGQPRKKFRFHKKVKIHKNN